MVPPFEIQADIFMSIESILTKACFKRKQLIIYLLSNHKIWIWMGKNLWGTDKTDWPICLQK